MTDDSARLLPQLLQSLTALEFVARHLDPTQFGTVIAHLGASDQTLRDTRRSLGSSGDANNAFHRVLTASDAVLAAFDGLRTVIEQGDDFYAVFRAMRWLPRAEEALYPLASHEAAVNRFFLDQTLHENRAALEWRMCAARDGETGVMHINNEPGSRGGYSLYVPETYTPDREWPLVMALHGGSGHGRSFLWSWLRAARSAGAILVAPTATGRTWALMGDDTDTPNLHRILDHVGERWRVDPHRRLLTGMSDGGTFCYVGGLESGSRFTHLGPVAATFHPLMADMADAERVRGLPIYMVHGVRDWMFPVEIARQARQSLIAAGAAVTYRELDDLSHCYPRDINMPMLAWMDGGAS